MKRQRIKCQMKVQNKTPEKELNKMETNNLPDAGFKTLVIRMLSDLSENFNKKIRNMKMVIENMKNQSEMKTTITKMNTLGGIKNKLDEAED